MVDHFHGDIFFVTRSIGNRRYVHHIEQNDERLHRSTNCYRFRHDGGRKKKKIRHPLKRCEHENGDVRRAPRKNISKIVCVGGGVRGIGEMNYSIQYASVATVRGRCAAAIYNDDNRRRATTMNTKIDEMTKMRKWT